jgi:hypothetical protein
MFQFPAAPTLGQIFTPVAGVSYQWTGQGWTPYVVPDVLPVFNAIINGDFNIWQRGTGFNPAAGFTADRWLLGNNTPSAYAVNRTPFSTSVIATTPRFFTNCVAIAAQTASVPTAAQICGFYQEIEGYNYAPLHGRAMTLSFYCASSVAGQYAVQLTNIVDQSITLPFTINVASTWERKVLAVPANLAGTWDMTTGRGLRIWFTLAAGSNNFNAIPNVWGAIGGATVAGQANLASAISQQFLLTGVQLETGNVDHEFVSLPYSEELARCQRYYWRRQATGTNQLAFSGNCFSSGQQEFACHFPVEMRAQPTLSVSAASDFYILGSGGTTPAVTVVSFGQDKLGAMLGASASGANVPPGGGAMLASANANAWIAFNAEI